MARAKISVIIPVYNAEKCIKKCIDSVRFQTYRDIEIIVVDEGSSDKSPDILNNYAEIDKRIRVFSVNNDKTYNAKAIGMKYAQGNYISFLEAGDWTLLSLYETFINSLNEISRDIDIFMFNGREYTGKNDIIPVKIFEISDWEKHAGKNTIHTFSDCLNPFAKNLSVINKIYRRKFLEENNITFPSQIEYGDMLFAIKSFLRAESIILSNEILYRYRDNKNILKTTRVLDIFKTVDMIEEEIKLSGMYDTYKYALFQLKYSTYSRYYKFCPDNLKENYYNKMKFALIASKTDDLNEQILSHLKNYEIYEQVKKCSRTIFDKFYRRHITK